MARVSLIKEQDASEEVAELYKTIRNDLGSVPNIFLAMGNSPAVLKGFLALQSSMHATTLSAQLREKIALAVGQINHCHYCLAAHTVLAKKAGLTDEQVRSARAAEDDDSKVKAILRFVRQSVENRGWASNDQIRTLRESGVSEKELVEIVLAIAVNMFTNYFNHIAALEVDFPSVSDV